MWGKRMNGQFTLDYWEAEEGGYYGQLREIPGVMSQGETVEELEENIRDAYQEFMTARREESKAEHSRVITVG